MIQALLFLLLIIMLLIAIWIVVSIFSGRVKEPSYERVVLKKGYEIRDYDPYIEATTIVDDSYANALYEGFRRIGGYIFGNNTKKQSIAMTAPVLDTALSEKKRKVSFVMPEGSKLHALPDPEDDRIKLVSKPRQMVAVISFRGPLSTQRIAKKQARLLALLAQDKITITDKPRSARYNPPWTFPLIARNEIQVAVSLKNK